MLIWPIIATPKNNLLLELSDDGSTTTQMTASNVSVRSSFFFFFLVFIRVRTNHTHNQMGVLEKSFIYDIEYNREGYSKLVHI